MAALRKSRVEVVLNWYQRIRAKLHTIILRPCFHSMGAHVSIAPPLRASNLWLVALGNGVTIHSGCWINVLHGRSDDGTPKIVMGNRVCIGMGATISAATQIVIGENVFTARNVYISDHGHEFHDVNQSIASQGIGRRAAVSIGADTWIGQNAVILPGVTIGRHCVIAANSVVRTDVPDFAVAAGAPARVVRAYDAESGRWDRAPVR